MLFVFLGFFIVGCYDTFIAGQDSFSVKAKLAGGWRRAASTPSIPAEKLIVGVNVSEDIKWRHLLIAELFFCYKENIVSGEATVVWHDPITGKDTLWTQDFLARTVWIDSTGNTPTLMAILIEVSGYTTSDTALWKIEAISRNLLKPQPEGILHLITPTHTYQFKYISGTIGKCLLM